MFELKKIVASLSLCLIPFFVHAGECYSQDSSCQAQWCSKDCGSFTMSGSYLYWNPCMDGIFTALEKKKITTLAEAYTTPNELEIMIETCGCEEQESEIEIINLVSLATSYRTASADITERVRKPSDCWNGGFRAGIGYHPTCGGCDFQLNWTWYAPTLKKTLVATPGTYFIPAIGLELSEALAESKNVFTLDDALDAVAASDLFPVWSGCSELQAENIQSRWQLSLNLVDLELGQMVDFCPCLKFRPHIDLRYVDIEHRVKTKSEGSLVSSLFDIDSNPEVPSEFVTGTYNTTATDAQLLLGFSSGQNLKQEFRAIGPRIGFDAELDVGCQCGIYGSFAVALVYGERSTKHTERATRLAENDLPIIDRIKQFPNGTAAATRYKNVIDSDDFNFSRKGKEHCTAVTTDLTIGIMWGSNSCFCDNDFDYSFRLGWEHHYFFNQGLKITTQPKNHYYEMQHDFSTQGLVASLTLGF